MRTGPTARDRRGQSPAGAAERPFRFFCCGWIKNQTKDRPDLQGDYTLAMMMQCSVTVYAVSGAFQNLAHYDLYYGLLAIIVIHRHIIGEKLKVPAAGEAQATEVPGNDYPEPGGVLQPAPAFAAARGRPEKLSPVRNRGDGHEQGKIFPSAELIPSRYFSVNASMAGSRPGASPAARRLPKRTFRSSTSGKSFSETGPTKRVRINRALSGASRCQVPRIPSGLSNTIQPF